MAESIKVTVPVVLTTLERQYVLKAIDALRQMCVRARSKEVDGSDSHRYRSADIAALDSVKEKFQ